MPVAVSQELAQDAQTATKPDTNEDTAKANMAANVELSDSATTAGAVTNNISAPSSATSPSTSNDPIADFEGDIDTNHDLPAQAIIKKIQNTIVLDEHGKSRPFKSVYTGPNVARRVLVIFIRHFFCGNCQEYLRTLSESIQPADLLSLEVPTSIAVIGCGAPSLIAQYRERTNCPFPIYADPTKVLYTELGMTRTLDMGARPEYQRASNAILMVRGFFQNLKQIPAGNALQDYKQVGGEFLFEPLGDIDASPLSPPQRGVMDDPEGYFDEEKRVTWCHRMKNTRDHAEVPELREVLGFEDAGKPGLATNEKRWSKAMGSRKGTGFSSMTRSETLREESEVAAAVPVGTANGH